MRILYLARKDLDQILRQKKSILFLLLMPLLFTWLMGMIFGQNESGAARLPVGLVIAGGEFLGGDLQTLLESSNTIHPLFPEQSDRSFLEDQVRARKLAAVVIVPPGFSEAALRGDAAQLVVIVDRDTPAGQAADRAIQLTTTRLLGAVAAARLSAAAYGEFPGEAERQTYTLAALRLGIRAWGSPRVAVELRATSPAPGIKGAQPGNGFAQSSPGMMVFFATIGMITPGYVLLGERRARTLERMLAAGLTRGELIAGHILAMFLIAFGQILLLTIFGQFAIGLDYWRVPGATLLMVTGLALWSASFGLLISSVARDENQVVLLVMASTLVFGLLGGAFFPLDLTDRTFALIGRLMPSAWAITGFQDILLRGAGLPGVLLPAAILLGFAVVTYGLAVRRFR